jgi:hypothetical protein
VYGQEYGVDSSFEGHVAASLGRTAKRGFPTEREAICLVERDGVLAGSVGLTDEGGGTPVPPARFQALLGRLGATLRP